MDKKQIKELEKDIRESLILHIEKTILYPYLAQDLNNKGYRKITENEVVISKAEYERSNKLFTYDKPIRNRCIDLITDVKEQTRKETAKEIFNALYKDTLRDGRPAVYKFLSPKDIKDMAKQYGVDLNEQSAKCNMMCKYFREIDYGYRHSKQCYAQKCAPEVTCNGFISDCSKYPKITAED